MHPTARAVAGVCLARLASSRSHAVASGLTGVLRPVCRETAASISPAAFLKTPELEQFGLASVYPDVTMLQCMLVAQSFASDHILLLVGTNTGNFTALSAKSGETATEILSWRGQILFPLNFPLE